MKFFGLRLVAIVLATLLGGTAASAGDAVPAKKLFGAVTLPTKGNAQSLGFYAKGCLSGGVAIPVDGPAWQVLHLSRNRRWGNPAMIALLERLAHDAKEKDGWPGLLVGDISQPRGGPMLSGHASHQIGLDADIWLTPMPDRELTYQERERFPENSVLKPGSLYVDPSRWTKAHAKLIMQAASYPEVERVFVHPGIKKKLCDTWQGDPSLLSKVRPIYGHHYHFHIRMKCPAGSQGCDDQVDPPSDSGCGKPLKEWFARLAPKPAPKVTKPTKPTKPKFLTLAQMPKACAVVLDSTAVASAAAAEFGAPSRIAANAFAATPDVPAVPAMDAEFGPLVPVGDVPIPLPRPSAQ